jgi:hypothetical protein
MPCACESTIVASAPISARRRSGPWPKRPQIPGETGKDSEGSTDRVWLFAP